MANPVRPAKSSSEWTRNELLAFNIRVENANTEEFFNTAQLPATQVSGTILNNVEMPDHPLPKNDRLFFRYLNRVHTSSTPESRVNDFAAFILRLLDYDDQDRIICRRPELLFPMAGQHVGTRSDLCVRDNDYYRLLVHEDKVSNSLLKSKFIAVSNSITSRIVVRSSTLSPRLSQQP